MENRQILERLRALRNAMKENGINCYMITSSDCHGSEYVHGHFRTRAYYSGFTGSSGTLLIGEQAALLWTDGRYFVQAEEELAGTGIELMRMDEKDVPTLEKYLQEKLQSGETLGFDGNCVNAEAGEKLEKACQEKGAEISYEKDIAGMLWKERPELPAEPVWELAEEYAGASCGEKLSRVRKELEQGGIDYLFLNSLDDIMWLFNIRGSDVECNPVAMSYAWLTEEETVLFIQGRAMDSDVKDYLAAKKVDVREYDTAVDYVKALPPGRRILLDKSHCSYALYKIAGEGRTVVEKNNPTELLKAVKNPTELANMEQIYLKDSVALTKFIYWLKTNIGKQEITELTAADKLEALRREIPECIDLSFPSISAYGANAAMMHYEPTPENHAVLEPKGLYLIDSGGQYLGGTTDVTRTIALGPVTEEQKLHYTMVAAAMLQMTNARFLYGCTGRNLDILARQPIWNMALDYKCGTGHGVGYILNVHEGPQSLRWQYVEGVPESLIEAGMDVTNEPGH